MYSSSFALSTHAVFQKVASITIHFGAELISAQSQHWETSACLLAVVNNCFCLIFPSHATVSGSRYKCVLPPWALDAGFGHPSPTLGLVQSNFTSGSSGCWVLGEADARRASGWRVNSTVVRRALTLPANRASVSYFANDVWQKSTVTLFGVPLGTSSFLHAPLQVITSHGQLEWGRGEPFLSLCSKFRAL